MTAPIAVGDRFSLTGRFLRSTGQVLGGEGPSVWTRVECDCGLCAGGGHIASDEAAFCLACDGLGASCGVCNGGPRHFAIGNVCRVGALDVRNVDVAPSAP